jgi:Capsid protein (F protein)
MSQANYGTNFRAPKVDAHQFAMIPRADIPRSQFRMQQQHKTTIGGSALVPVYLQEVLPGDSFNVSMSSFCRLATPLFPIMDNIDLESFFFFVPCRLVWVHWYKFMGEQDNPSDSISYTIPTLTSAAGGFAVNTIYDYLGLPTVGQVGGANTVTVSALPLRCYNLIWNQWFRDENLQVSQNFGSGATTGPGGSACMDDGPDSVNLYAVQAVNRRHDYFTSCLPWTQKGGVAITLPLGTSAPVKTQVAETFTGTQAALSLRLTTGLGGSGQTLSTTAATPGLLLGGTTPAVGGTTGNWYPTNLYADLSVATAATINAIRLAFQTQKLLERDARGGTRYTEIVRSHFGVISPDARLQRPEYLGGGRTPITMSPVPQTSQTGLTGGTTPLGTLAGVGTLVHRAGFRQSFTEHGYILGLVAMRATQGYQQGMRKLWSRSTRYDFYFPVFAALGEQAVLNKEIYCDGSANDPLTFGYQERWAEYRYHPSYTSGFFRSTSATPLDAWHMQIKYASLPVLNSSFVADATGTTLQRNLALGASSANQQLLCDFFFDQRVARPMPMYSVPGLIDHF